MVRYLCKSYLEGWRNEVRLKKKRKRKKWLTIHIIQFGIFVVFTVFLLFV